MIDRHTGTYLDNGDGARPDGLGIVGRRGTAPPRVALKEPSPLTTTTEAARMILGELTR